MASYTQWGQRKALGKRYETDPAYDLEYQRLMNEYNLAPGREARAMSAKQFEENLAFQREQSALTAANNERAIKAGETGSMVGTIGNVLTTGAMLYGMGAFKDKPPATEQVVPTYDASVATGNPGLTGGSGMTGNEYVPSPPPSTSPAYVDAGLGEVGGMGTTASGSGEPLVYGSTAYEQALAEGGGAIPAAEGMGAAAGGEAAAATLSGAGTAALSAAPYAVAGYYAAKFGGKALSNMAGKDTTLGKIGETIATPTEGIGRSVYREFVGNDDGVETAFNVFDPLGYGIGEVLKAVGSWICSEISKVEPWKMSELKALSRLVQYSIDNHPEDAEAYLPQEKGSIMYQEIPSQMMINQRDKVLECIRLTQEDKWEEAFLAYRKMWHDMCEECGFDVKTLYVKEAA